MDTKAHPEYMTLEPAVEPVAAPEAVDQFIHRWHDTGGTERANYQLFLTELSELLGLPKPDPASDDTADNAYVFERRVTIRHPDGSENRGYIDLYRRGCFVLEAKQTGKNLNTQGWDKAMLAAQNQADQYVRALPGDEGRPPFIVVTDVGRSLELYAEFSRSGGTYVPFPDPANHRIRLEDLRNPGIQQRLCLLWLDPDQLDASKHAARVTRQVSAQLAELAKSLEQGGYEVERVAHFLKRCLFTMFSEDVDLLPKGSFTALLERLQKSPEHFPDALRSLWETMNTGGYEGQLMQKIQRFNGGLFQNIDPIPLNADQIGLLIKAAKADWRYVEPAIFGTLLERALDPRERHKLGAHYTPRAYVERLVMPTIIEPLRAEWSTVQVAAEAWLQQDKADKAREEVKRFHHRLCEIRVLDPACGSGNFLYVALEHFKRLEGEVQNVLRDLSDGQSSFDTGGLTVDPHQFLGLEINPRAAAIAEIVLWIGYLQWHHRINGKLELPEPILRNFKNIENRDALIEYDTREPMRDDQGKEVTIWDGTSYKKSPITGELIPDETQRIPVYHYTNPRRAEWPEADYIIGNPPFIGEKRMRDALGNGYTEAVRDVYKELPACDFVMYWWHRAAELVATKSANQFGLITTNSLVQSRNRGVVEPHLHNGVSLVFAIPDHPWVDSDDGAAVRIAITVGANGHSLGKLFRVRREEAAGDDARHIELQSYQGIIYANLTVGAALVDAKPLKSNDGLVFQGVKLVGNGFLVSPEQRAAWIKHNSDWENYLPQLIAGSDLTKRKAPRYCIDFFGLNEKEARESFPPGFQQVTDQVKPFRIENSMKSRRELWWIHGAPAAGMRRSLDGLNNYIATSEVSKHRYFVVVDRSETLADGSLAVVAHDDYYVFGVLSSRVHVLWALSQGGRMGMGNDPRWQNGPCFLNFPFPEVPSDQEHLIRKIAEGLSNHRTHQQHQYSTLNLTAMYNVLEKVNAGHSLTDIERKIYEQALVSSLKEFHDDLDRAVLRAYGWCDLANILVGRPGATTPLPNKPTEQAGAEEELLSRLVALNVERTGEEAKGNVRWLRPACQAPEAMQPAMLSEAPPTAAPGPVSNVTKKAVWPKSIPEQVVAVRRLLTEGAQSEEALSENFKRKPIKAVGQVLAALEVLGQATREGGTWRIS